MIKSKMSFAEKLLFVCEKENISLELGIRGIFDELYKRGHVTDEEYEEIKKRVY